MGPDPQLMAPEPCTTAIFEFNHYRIAELKRQVSYHMWQQNAMGWVSATDCLCALLWIAVMRARARRLGSGDISKFTTAVDARSRVGRPMPDYMGNLIVAATAEMTVEQLIGRENYLKLAGFRIP